MGNKFWKKAKARLGKGWFLREENVFGWGCGKRMSLTLSRTWRGMEGGSGGFNTHWDRDMLVSMSKTSSNVLFFEATISELLELLHISGTYLVLSEKVLQIFFTPSNFFKAYILLIIFSTSLRCFNCFLLFTFYEKLNFERKLNQYIYK